MTLALFLLAFAAQQTDQGAYAREHHCDAPTVQMDMNACAGLEFERADAELNRVWQRVVAQTRAADREVNRDSDNRGPSEAYLRAAQRAWLTFREQHCTYSGMAEARGGTMEPMSYEGCRTQVTQARIRQLTGEGEPAQ